MQVVPSLTPGGRLSIESPRGGVDVDPGPWGAVEHWEIPRERFSERAAEADLEAGSHGTCTCMSVQTHRLGSMTAL